MKHLLPKGWPRPKGYSNGILAEGQFLFVAGMIGWDEHGRFPVDFVSQLAQVLKNTVAVLEAGGTGPGKSVLSSAHPDGAALPVGLGEAAPVAVADGLALGDGVDAVAPARWAATARSTASCSACCASP